MENKKDSGKSTSNTTSADQKTGENTVMHSDFTNEQDEKEQDFPGYPHYPASEDILNPANSEGRLELDVENLTRSSKTADLNFTQDTLITSTSDAELPITPAMKEDEDDLGIVPGTEADVTADDLIILGARNQDQDMGEDEDIRNRSGFDLGSSGDDLDVPGSESDDDNELIGEEDEENNYYSLGGDEKDSLESDV